MGNDQSGFTDQDNFLVDIKIKNDSATKIQQNPHLGKDHRETTILDDEVEVLNNHHIFLNEPEPTPPPNFDRLESRDEMQISKLNKNDPENITTSSDDSEIWEDDTLQNETNDQPTSNLPDLNNINQERAASRQVFNNDGQEVMSSIDRSRQARADLDLRSQSKSATRRLDREIHT